MRDPAAGRIPPLSVEELARLLPELEVFELIGEGGMGAVYRARHRKLDRSVAVKLLGTALRTNPAFSDRFEREARTMASLDHPNVVTIYDFGQREGHCYLVMEFVDGVNLRQMIEGGSLTPDTALQMVPNICSALQYAHDRGVVHRDIKPENILVDRRGVVKIADFGLAKLVGGEASQRLTRTEQIMGTPNYMAPEQIEKPGEVDHRADIYALGVVFYELLTGELPVGRFPAPSKTSSVDGRLDDVVFRTLEKDPSQRYQQASELGTDVESISAGLGQADRAGQASAESGATSPELAGAVPYEFRSDKALFGIPLVHIAFSRDPEGLRMRTARGFIAIGDVAIGAVAIGAFSVGGISFGGISVGIVGFGGVAIGLLTAMGGVALGAFSAGGCAVGLVSRGATEFNLLGFSEAEVGRVMVLAWLIGSVAIAVSAAAGAYAWSLASRSE